MTKLPLALTMGDPAGVGAEITLKAWLGRHNIGHELPAFFCITDKDHLARTAERLNLSVPISSITCPAQALDIFSTRLPVLHLPLTTPAIWGTPDKTNANVVIESIKMAVKLTQDNQSCAVVTNPIAKSVLYQAGFDFPGHTEFLAHLSGDDYKPVMMLACDQLRVVLATVHVSIFKAAQTLNTETICEIARITNQALKSHFGLFRPTIAVAGLNPHAGENGAMGDEELTIISPAIETLRKEGINVFGPLPPDTMFTTQALPTYDVALCMYHDQGLIPLKALDFENAVNTTLGLPFVRTSPDHGTAFDIAGTGQAREHSLVSAIKMAHRMTDARTGF